MKILQDFVALLVAGAAAFCALGYQRPAKSLPPRLDNSDPPVDERMHAALAAIDLQQVKLDGALHAIQEKVGMPVMVEWDGLFSPLDSVVDVHLKNATAAAVMTALVRAADHGNSGWTAANGVITVTTQERIDETGKVVVRVYDVHQLARKAATMLGEERPYTFSQSQTLAATSSVYTTEAQETEEIVRLITDNIMPETWQDNGGSIGSISRGSSVLVIAHTERAHAQIAELLRLLDRAQ